MRADGGHQSQLTHSPGTAPASAPRSVSGSMVAVGGSLAVTGKRRHATAAARPPAAGINA
jgi:hypothetical protein